MKYIFSEQEEQDWNAWLEYCREQERKYSELHGKPSWFWNPDEHRPHKTILQEE